MTTSAEHELGPFAKELDVIIADSGCEPGYDIMADALVWPDETPDEAKFELINALRPVRRYRTSLITGLADERFADWWRAAKALFPNWVGFSDQRCLPNKELSRFYVLKRKAATKGLCSLANEEEEQ